MISIAKAQTLTPEQAKAEMSKIRRIGRVTQATERGIWDALYEIAYPR